jgi:hypothetical protein
MIKRSIEKISLLFQSVIDALKTNGYLFLQFIASGMSSGADIGLPNFDS